MTNPIPKYRPSLSEEELLQLYSYITQIDLNDIVNEVVHAKLVSKFKLLIMKLDNGIASPAYVAKNLTIEKKCIEDELGMDMPTTDPMIYKAANYNRYLRKDPKLTQSKTIDALDYKVETLKEPLTEEEQDIYDNSWG